LQPHKPQQSEVPQHWLQPLLQPQDPAKAGLATTRQAATANNVAMILIFGSP
jgi:hypothetical protein